MKTLLCSIVLLAGLLCVTPAQAQCAGGSCALRSVRPVAGVVRTAIRPRRLLGRVPVLRRLRG